MGLFLYLQFLFRDILATTLVVSGSGKLIDSAGFGRALITFRVFPQKMLRPLVLLVPLMELGLAAWILSGYAIHLSALAAVILFGVFALLIAWNLLRGVEFSCGCFGSDRAPATWLTAWRNLALIACSGYLLFYQQPASQPFWRVNTGSFVVSQKTLMVFFVSAAITGGIFLISAWYDLDKVQNAQSS